jgi:carbon-monoxide dehydrogenase medium subunit
LDEAIGLLTQHGEDARIVAGGHSLILTMKLRLAKPEHLVELQNLDELRGIRSEPDVSRMAIPATTCLQSWWRSILPSN